MKSCPQLFCLAHILTLTPPQAALLAEGVPSGCLETLKSPAEQAAVCGWSVPPAATRHPSPPTNHTYFSKYPSFVDWLVYTSPIYTLLLRWWYLSSYVKAYNDCHLWCQKFWHNKLVSSPVNLVKWFVFEFVLIMTLSWNKFWLEIAFLRWFLTPLSSGMVIWHFMIGLIGVSPLQRSFVTRWVHMAIK